MPTATKPKTAAKPKTESAAKPKTESAAKARAAGQRHNRETVDRTADFADQTLEQLKNGGQNVIGAVRRFVGSVDDALPGSEDGPSRGHDIIDSALDMSDRIVESGSEAIRGIVKSAGKTLGTAAKK
jgi:hypothetical protein